MDNKKDELPAEVTTGQVEQYAKRLLDITSPRVDVKMRDEIPEEVVDFIGKERAEMSRRLEAVTQLNFALLEVVSTFPKSPETEEKSRQLLNEKIRNLVNSSQDAGESMDLIAHIWKYFGETAQGKYEPKGYRISPGTVSTELNRYARELGIEPLTHDEIHALFPAVRDWKLGKSPEQILKTFSFGIDHAFNKANPASREGRLIAKYKGENRPAMNDRFFKLCNMRDFLKKLFGTREENEK